MADKTIIILDRSMWNGYSTSYRIINGKLKGEERWEVTRDYKHVKPVDAETPFIKIIGVFENGILQPGHSLFPGGLNA